MMVPLGVLSGRSIIRSLSVVHAPFQLLRLLHFIQKANRERSKQRLEIVTGGRPLRSAAPPRHDAHGTPRTAGVCSPTVRSRMELPMQKAAAVAIAIASLTGHAAYQDDWGPPVGATLPLVAAADQTGTQRDLASLAGERGLLLFFVRSANW